MNQEIMPAYAAYQKAIDLTLYHAFAELVVQTSQDDKARMHYRQIEAAQIWQQDVDVSIYFEQYSLRYPGEVLERFEEKLGTDIRIVRALALALAVTRTLHADQMFVGSQRSGFFQKIRRIADGDVYLSGALYHLEEDTVRQRALLDALAKTEYTKTEEALFVLSLFDDREEGYQVMHAQLLRLFGPERTMPLAFNCGVLEWFIRTYAEQVKACRSRADLVLRTLVKLPCMNMKQDSREFAVLTAAGYGADEIILTNSLAMWMDRISYRLCSFGFGLSARKVWRKACTSSGFAGGGIGISCTLLSKNPKAICSPVLSSRRREVRESGDTRKCSMAKLASRNCWILYCSMVCGLYIGETSFLMFRLLNREVFSLFCNAD